MRPVQALGIALADAVGISAAARGFRQSALDHLFGGLEESFEEPLLPTHHLILRYDSLILASREKRQELSKMFWNDNSCELAETWARAD